MMPTSELLALGEKVIEVPPPPGRVLAGTMPPCFGGIEHLLNAPPQA